MTARFSPASAWTGTRNYGPTTSATTRGVAWLAQEPVPALEAEAARIAGLFGLSLTRIDTGLDRLESALAKLIGKTA
ncbi:MAG: hypothetical protein ACRDN0_26915 [Trebonia sp.]